MQAFKRKASQRHLLHYMPSAPAAIQRAMQYRGCLCNIS